ncbi:GFA family protein [Caldimonas sp. KR1-144]|uniref:GFA family protein n=1 Tax=Caldimonas sp. KR1-144 TaxID=3400911 RepID=UPI003BFF6C3C
MKQTFRGSCHCGKVRFTAGIDLDAGARRCSCAACVKTRAWSVIVEPQDFRLLGGEQHLCDHTAGSATLRHLFCDHCGVRPFGRGRLEAVDGEVVAVNLACLDEVDPALLAAAWARIAKRPLAGALRYG